MGWRQYKVLANKSHPSSSLPTPRPPFFCRLLSRRLRNTWKSQNLSKASFPTRSPGNHIILFHRCGIGIGEEREDKNFRRFPPSFRTNETSHLVFPTEEKVSFLILLLFPRSPSLIDVWNDLARGKHSRDDRKNVPNPWPVHEMAGEWSDAEGERIGTREGLFMRATLPRERFVCLSLCLGGN